MVEYATNTSVIRKLSRFLTKQFNYFCEKNLSVMKYVLRESLMTIVSGHSAPLLTVNPLIYFLSICSFTP